MEQIFIYSTKICPNCKKLKQLLERDNIQYKEIDMSTPAGLTELRMKSVFAMAAPVLQIGEKYYTTKELLTDDIIDPNKLDDIIKRDATVFN